MWACTQVSSPCCGGVHSCNWWFSTGKGPTPLAEKKKKKKKKAEKDAQGRQQQAQMSGQGQLQAPSSHETKSLIESSDLVGQLTPT